MTCSGVLRSIGKAGQLVYRFESDDPSLAGHKMIYLRIPSVEEDK